LRSLTVSASQEPRLNYFLRTFALQNLDKNRESFYNLGSAFHTARLVLHFPFVLSTPAFSTPAFSTPATCSRIFHSYISTLAFLPVSHFPLPHFQSPPQKSNEISKKRICSNFWPHVVRGPFPAGGPTLVLRNRRGRQSMKPSKSSR